MEPTMNTASSAKGGSKVIIWIVIILVVIVGIMLAMRNKTEAPTGSGSLYGTSSGESDKSEMTAEVNSATTFDNEASMNAIDKEFQ